MNNACSPIFIIGNPRSGTSLLRLLLMSHSKITVPPECGFIVWLYPDFKNWKKKDNNLRLQEFIQRLINCRKFDTWDINAHEIEAFIQLEKPTRYSELCHCIYKFYTISMGKRPYAWGDKNNFYVHHLSELNSIYPHARFIHIVRDGRDVCCSYKEVMKLETTSPYAPELKIVTSEVANEWASNVLKINTFFKRQLYGNALTLRYEDLVSKPTMILTRLCLWLGLQYETEMLDFFIHNKTNKLEPDITMDWKRKTLTPIDNANVGRYKRMLTSEEIAEFESIAQAGLREFHYIVDDS